MRSVSASESTVSISLKEESDSLAVARPFTRDGEAVDEDSVTEICGIEGPSVVVVEFDATDDVFVPPRERPLTGLSDCCCGAEFLSETGDNASTCISISTKGCFPFSRDDEVGAERPRIWGADVESAESVDRDRFTSRWLDSVRV